MFDVFGSVWFAAIYLLLFVSLIGCLVPRIRVHARAVARKPLPAPRNLDRLPESGSLRDRRPARRVRGGGAARAGRRWRVEQRAEPSGAITLSAEKGYSRETGNLIFHVALLVSLVLIAVGRLYSYQGSMIVVQGTGFCNTISNYDQWKPGRFAAEGKVYPAPFCIDKVSRVHRDLHRDNEPTEFRADLTYRPTLDSPDAARRRSASTTRCASSGDRVYLINHGFAPRSRSRMPDGSVVHDIAALHRQRRDHAALRGRVQGAGRRARTRTSASAGCSPRRPRSTARVSRPPGRRCTTPSWPSSPSRAT